MGASINGLGAILKQPQSDGIEKPVTYFSKKLNDTPKKEKNTIYLECLAIKYWQYWLLRNKFTVLSDHRPLETFNMPSRPDEELYIGDLTHTNFLSQFDFEIQYNPGKVCRVTRY